MVREKISRKGPDIGLTSVMSPEELKAGNDVATPNPEYTEMSTKYWILVDDLNGGTQAMRDAGQTWLPKAEKEDDKDYQERLKRSFLYGAYADTVDDLVGKPFSYDVTVEKPELLDDRFVPVIHDADRLGKKLSSHAKECFRDAVNYGLTHTLVDFPIVEERMNLQEERNSGVRPMFTRISPKDLIGWRTVKDEEGRTILDQIRIKGCTTEPVGAYGQRKVKTIRVINRTTWELHKQIKKKDGKSEWIIDKSGVNTLGYIPLVTTYFNQTGYLTAKPCLLDLAWANLQHWQSSSDQNHILHYSRVPFLFGAGWSEDEIKKGVEIGATRMLRSTKENAKLNYVEIQGKSLEAGQKDLEHIEEQMETLGLQPTTRASARATATRTVVDADRREALIHDWVRELELGLNQQFRVGMTWYRKDLSDDFRVEIYSDFAIGSTNNSDMDIIVKMREKGDISAETTISEAKRRSILSETVDAEQEKVRTTAEDMNLVRTAANANRQQRNTRRRDPASNSA